MDFLTHKFHNVMEGPRLPLWSPAHWQLQLFEAQMEPRPLAAPPMDWCLGGASELLGHAPISGWYGYEAAGSGSVGTFAPCMVKAQVRAHHNKVVSHMLAPSETGQR